MSDRQCTACGGTGKWWECPAAPQHADVAKVIEYRGRQLLTSHSLFGDFDETPVAELVRVERGHVVVRYFDVETARRRREFVARREQEWERMKRARGNAEMEFEHLLASRIEASGRRIRRQVRVSAGIIDILVEDPPLSIIEVKVSGSVGSIGHALTQLFSYETAFPGARLYVATVKPLHAQAIVLLERCGVSLWE
jgi:hypothetical protein